MADFNCMFLWPNYADPGVLYTPDFAGGSWESDLPLANLQDRYLENVARSSSEAVEDTQFRIDLKADRPVRGVALPNAYGELPTGLSSSAYVRVLGVPSSVLFSYEAGDDIAAKGGTFTRADAATVARYSKFRGGINTEVAADVLRDRHFINGVQHTLLERSGENILTRSIDLDVGWTTSNSSVVANADTASDGTMRADRLIWSAAPAAAHSVRRTPSVATTADVTHSFSIELQGGHGITWVALSIRSAAATANLGRVWFNLDTGAVGTASNGGSATGARGWIRPIENGYYLCTVSVNLGGGLTDGQGMIFLAETDGQTNVVAADGTSYVLAFAAHFENNVSFAATGVLTGPTALTRAADVLSFSIPSGLTTPAASTFYLKFVEQGTLFVSSSRLIQISESGDDIRSLRVQQNGATPGMYTAILADAAGATTSQSTAAIAPSIGDTVELRVTISATGVVQLHQSINGAAEVAAAAGAVGGLPASWGSGTAAIWVNSRGATSQGAVALQSIRAVADVQTLSYMQSIVYDSGWLNQYPSGHTAETLEGMNVPWSVILPATQTPFRYCSVQIDDTENPNEYVDLGRIVIGGGWQPSYNMAPGAMVGLEPLSVVSRSDGGAGSYNRKPTLRTWQFTLDNLLLGEAMASGFDMQRIAGTDRQIYFIYDPTDIIHRHRLDGLLVLRRLSGIQAPFSALYGTLAFEGVEEI